jgi:hypothetical protein
VVYQAIIGNPEKQMPHPIDRNPDPASEREADRRLHDRDQRENTAKTSDTAGSEPGNPKPPRIGEVIPDKKETEEAAGAASELFFQASGLDKVPRPGQVNIAVKAAEIQAQRSEGISRGQNVTYTDARGETMIGGQYTREDGTYFKTAQGLTFKVEANQQNGFDLRLTTGSSETFVAIRMDVLRDAFSSIGERLANISNVHAQTIEPNLAPTIRPIPLPAHESKSDTPPGERGTRSDSMPDKESSGSLLGERQPPFDTATTPKGKLDIGPDTPIMQGEKPEPVPQITRTFEVKPELPPPAAIPAEINTEPAVRANIAPASELEAPLDITSAAPVITESTVSHLEAEVTPLVVPASAMGSSITEGQVILEQAAQSVAIEKSEKELKEQEEAERLEREAIKLRIQQREEGKRRRYLVKEKDTLESIAIKQLKDVRLASLICEINKHLIPAKVVRGRAVRELKPRMTIFLPTSAEIEKFRYGQQPDTVVMGGSTSRDITEEDKADIAVESVSNEIITTIGSAITALKEPKEKPIDDAPASSEPAPAPNAQSESLQSGERIYYSVRLGDTLKSIAVRQPSLSDPSLWALIAQVNGLSDAVDAAGSPETKLVRGMRLALPTESEIETFKQVKKGR